MTADVLWPLFDYFPELAKLGRVPLRRDLTPVQFAPGVGQGIWVKRDDLTAEPIGGNKVRALEFLLGRAQRSRATTVVTAGASGSTHALTTCMHASALGMKTVVATWPQEMNPVAERVSERLDAEAARKRFTNAGFAVAWLQWRRLRGDHVIPPGATSWLGILGHVNGALELAAQVRAGALPEPKRVVVPLGTGGTAAGLTLGFSLAGMDTRVIGARVVPRIVGRQSRVKRLVGGTRWLIDALTARKNKWSRDVDFTVDHTVYGGAYGRALPAASTVAAQLHGVEVDPSYSAKALAAASRLANDEATLFWLTFDSRWLHHGEKA